MIVPRQATDDLGQEADASITFLRYGLVLRLVDDSNIPVTMPPLAGGQESIPGIAHRGLLQIEQEELSQINLGDAATSLRFPHNRTWRQSVLTGKRVTSFISTELESSGNRIKIHQDGRQGRALKLLASTLPRTLQFWWRDVRCSHGGCCNSNLPPCANPTNSTRQRALRQMDFTCPRRYCVWHTSVHR